MHLNGIKHTKVLEDARAATAKSAGSVLSTRQRGCPTSGGKGIIRNQADLHSWFKQANHSNNLESGSANTGQGDSILALLCWRFR